MRYARPYGPQPRIELKISTATCILFLLFLFTGQETRAQIGGLGTFDFLNLTQSARSVSLGGHPIALSDDDVSQVFNNPALLNPKMTHHLGLHQNFHFADINFGSFAYAIPAGTTQLFFGANYVNYGSFIRADILGNRQGEFDGSEAAIHIGGSRQLDERLRIGITMKYAYSNLDNYSASGIGADVGVVYSNAEETSSLAIVLRNVGGQISSFASGREGYPTELQIGFQKKLAHIPFRYMITAHSLQRWNLRSPGDSETQVIFLGSTDPQEPSSFSNFIDNFFRHFAFGGEFLIGKNEIVRLRLGYNHLLNKELSVSGFRSLSGFSFGFGVKVKKIRLDYGVGRYHLAGGVNHISLTIDLNDLFQKL